MEKTYLGHGQVTLEESPLIYMKKISVSTKSSAKKVHCIGAKAFSPGVTDVSITIDQARPVGGEQFDYEALVDGCVMVDLDFYEASGTVHSYTCIITEYSKDDGPDEEPTCKLSLEGFIGK